MSRASMLERAKELPRAPLAGIGRYRDADDNVVDFEIGWDELRRDTAWAGTLMDEWGLACVDAALLTMGGHEASWLSPIQRCLHDRGVTMATAETYPWDARRAAMFVTLLRPRALFGLARSTLDALDLQARQKVLDVPALFCRPDSYLEVDADARPALIAFVGPALAIECPARSGAHLDSAEWHVEADGAGLRLSAVAERAYRPGEEYLDVGCWVVEGSCECGRTGNRLVRRP